MKEVPSNIKQFWVNFCNVSNDKPEFVPNFWSFGESSEMADDLLAYVVSGEKTATSGMVLDFEVEAEPIPTIGEKLIVLNGKKDPVCIIEMIDVQKKKFKDVDEEFALKEAEGFKSLQDWRDVHWDFFTRRSKAINVELTDDIELACMEFKVIYPI